MFSWEIWESFKNAKFWRTSANNCFCKFIFSHVFLSDTIWYCFNHLKTFLQKHFYIASYHVYQLTFGVSFNIFCFWYIGKCQFYHTKLSFSKIIKRSRKFTVNKENVKTVSIEVYAVSHWSLEQSFAGNLAVIYLFQLNSGNTRTICKICWKLKYVERH